MNSVRQVLLGILAALLSGAIVLGGLTLSMAETGQKIARVPSTPTAQQPVPTSAPGQPTYTASPTSLPSATPTPLATSENCPPPPGWVAVSTMDGGTVESLAQLYGSSAAELRLGNCLPVDWNILQSNTLMYVPELPTVTATSTPLPPSATPGARETTAVKCGPPASWVVYIVRPGDTLTSLAQQTGTTVGRIQEANCMGSKIKIRAGQDLWLPGYPPAPPVWPTSTPRRPTATWAPPPTEGPTWAPPPTDPPPTSPPPTAEPTWAPPPTSPPPTDPPPTRVLPTQSPPTQQPPEQPTDPPPVEFPTRQPGDTST